MNRAASPGDEWPSLGVVVPVYNEAAGIQHALRRIVDVANEYRGRCTVIAVDDGSADESWTILSRLAQELEPLDVLRHQANAGYGQALRTGASRAQALALQYVAFIDSDLTNPPEDLLKIGPFAREGHAYIKASRFVSGGSMAAVPLQRRAVSRAGNFVAAALFGTKVRDVTNGFRAAQTDVFCSWSTRERTFAVIVEEFACALRDGIEPVEFPSVLTARSGQQRRSAFSYSPRLVLSYLRYPLLARLRSPIRR